MSSSKNTELMCLLLLYVFVDATWSRGQKLIDINYAPWLNMGRIKKHNIWALKIQLWFHFINSYNQIFGALKNKSLFDVCQSDPSIRSDPLYYCINHCQLMLPLKLKLSWCLPVIHLTQKLLTYIFTSFKVGRLFGYIVQILWDEFDTVFVIGLRWTCQVPIIIQY